MCREIFGDDFKKLVPAAVVGIIPADRLPSLNQHQSRVRTRSVRQGQRAGQPHRTRRKLNRHVLERPKIFGQPGTEKANDPPAGQSRFHGLTSYLRGHNFTRIKAMD